jgi:LPS export ABC transporter protein LptC
MKKVKIALLSLIVVISGVVLVVLWVNLQGKGSSGDKEEPPKVINDDAKMRLEKIHFVEDKEGRKTWELEAKSIHQYEDEDILTLEAVKVTVYTRGGRSFVISGRQGKVNQKTKDAELEGGVIMTSSDGYRLKTQSIAYRHGEKKVTTSDAVEIEGEEIRVTGKGMLVDMEARTFKILSGVKTQWRGGGKG